MLQQNHKGVTRAALSINDADPLPPQELLVGFESKVPASESSHLLVERVVVDSYEKNKPPRSPEPVITWPWPQVEEWRSYDPLAEESALFKTFADLDPTPLGCLAFANRYGGLGQSVGYQIQRQTHEEMNGGEPVRIWRAAVLWMRYLIALWEAARAKDVNRLSGLVEWRGDYFIRFLNLPTDRHDLPRAQQFRTVPLHPESTIMAGDIRPFDFGRITGGSLVPGELAAPALLFCSHAINVLLEGLVAYRMVWNATERRPVCRIVPADLWSAMLVQLMLAIDGARNYHRCPVCRRWFELAPGLNKSNKLFCSAACRTRATRQKQERAIRLFAEGMTPAKIAKEVGSDFKVVKGWVKIKKKGK